jgi:hypothetical protein
MKMKANSGIGPDQSQNAEISGNVEVGHTENFGNIALGL